MQHLFVSSRRVLLGGQTQSVNAASSSSPGASAIRSSSNNICPDQNERPEPTLEQEAVMIQLRCGTDAWDQLGLYKGCKKEDVNKIYRKLAILLHPDKTAIKGADEAFKLLCAARRNILMSI